VADFFTGSHHSRDRRLDGYFAGHTAGDGGHSDDGRDNAGWQSDDPKGQTEQTNPEGQTQTPEQQTPLGTHSSSELTV